MRLLIKFFSLLLFSYLEAQIFFSSTLFSDTLTRCSSLDLGNLFLHIYKITCEIITLCIIIFRVLDSEIKKRSSGLNGS